MTNKNSLVVFFHRLAPTLSRINRFGSTKSNTDLGAQMKQLNDAKQFKQALSLFDAHKQSAHTDMAINQALKACINLRDFQRGPAIHQRLSPRSLSCHYIQVSLVQLYMRCNDWNNAQRVFASVPDKHRTVFLYTAMISGLASNNRLEEAFNVFEKMTIKPDVFLLPIIFNVCTQLDNDRAFEIGCKMFSQMPDDYYKKIALLTSALHMFLKYGDMTKGEELIAAIKSKDVALYGAMMKGYNMKNDTTKVLALFERMKKEGIKPDKNIFISVAHACSQIGMIERCRSIFAHIPKHFLGNKQLQNALIHMWDKVDSVEEAQRVFETMHNPNVISFNAMIHLYGVRAMGRLAIDLYKRMPANMRNDFTHISVLNACSQSCLPDDTRSIFAEISPKTVKVILAMVDSLSRMELFDEAQKLVDDFEQCHEPNLAMYLVMISKARDKGNNSLSQELFDKMKTRLPDYKDHLTSARKFVADTYSFTHEQNPSSNIRQKIDPSDSKEQICQSSTYVHGELFKFRERDRSSAINAELVRISKELIKQGHPYEGNWMSRGVVKSETTRSSFSGHSERLALALNFIQNPIPSVIQIVNNIRMCEDCHEFMKSVAKIRQREIIVRDANRVHHFYTNGQCSCRDHL